MASRRLRLAALLATGLALLAAGLGAASSQDAGPVQEASAAAVAGLDDRSVLNPLSELALDRLTGFRDRPLFTPARRPPAPPQAEPEPEPVAVVDEPETVEDAVVEAPSVMLSGIVEIESDRVAMLRDMATSTTLSVRVGDPVESWTVASIDDASVTLEHEGERHEIKMFQPGGDAPSPPRAGGEDGTFDPETGEYIAPSGAVFDPETGEMRQPRGNDSGGRAIAVPPPDASYGEPPPEPNQDEIVDPETQDFGGDATYDAAVDGDVVDAADDLDADPNADMDVEDVFGTEDLDGDGIPDSEQLPPGG
jgi:hypothetical protein